MTEWDTSIPCPKCGECLEVSQGAVSEFRVLYLYSCTCGAGGDYRVFAKAMHPAKWRPKAKPTRDEASEDS